MTGGIGFISDAKKNYEHNLGYLDKFYQSHFKRHRYRAAKKKIYKFRQSTPEQLKEIKKRIRARERKLRNTSILLLIAVVLFFIILGVILFAENVFVS